MRRGRPAAPSRKAVCLRVTPCGKASSGAPSRSLPGAPPEGSQAAVGWPPPCMLADEYFPNRRLCLVTARDCGRLGSRASGGLHSGWWRSLVAHLTGGQGVAGSNPVHPTRKHEATRRVASFLSKLFRDPTNMRGSALPKGTREGVAWQGMRPQDAPQTRARPPGAPRCPPLAESSPIRLANRHRDAHAPLYC